MFSGESATIIPAEPGYHLAWFGGSDPKLWHIDKVQFFRVIAWQFNSNGQAMPRTINPVMDNQSQGRYVLVTPDGAVLGWNVTNGAWYTAPSLGDWIQLSQLADSPYPPKPS